MGFTVATGPEFDLITSANEGLVLFEAKPNLGPSSFLPFFSAEDEDPLPQPTIAERKSEAFLSSPENLSQAPSTTLRDQTNPSPSAQPKSRRF
jgi:hypothetical protein